MSTTTTAQWLKRSASAQAKADADRQVRGIVDAARVDIEQRGDVAMRQMIIRFDGCNREDYRLTQAEIANCVERLTVQERKDMEFAQAQVRGFSQIQRSSMQDVEVETLPRLALGHKHIPVNAAGCYFPRGKHPLLASALMSVITARVAGVPRAITCAPTFIETPFTQPFFDDPAFKTNVLDKIMLRRIGQVEDLMGAVLFLASVASTLMTGTSLIVDGGWTAD